VGEAGDPGCTRGAPPAGSPRAPGRPPLAVGLREGPWVTGGALGVGLGFFEGRAPAVVAPPRGVGAPRCARGRGRQGCARRRAVGNAVLGAPELPVACAKKHTRRSHPAPSLHILAQAAAAKERGGEGESGTGQRTRQRVAPKPTEEEEAYPG